jgi:hypothetical protein
MKSFNQTITDIQGITKDNSADTLTLLKMWVNECVHHDLSLSDWNFNKDSKQYTSVAQQQDYDTPYNAAKISYVRIYVGGIWYTPKEVKSGTLWSQLNYVNVYSDIPIYWHVHNRTRKVSIYPIPSSTSQTIKVGFTKKVRDLSVADYTTGTISTTANSLTIVGAGGATFNPKMVGRWIKITSTDTVLGDMWFEISDYTNATTILVRESIPVAVTGASYTIAEMIPFMEGFEDIALRYALDKYYQFREKPTLAREYERMWTESLTEMMSRDQRSADGVLEKETPLQVIDPNRNPWAIEIKMP